MSDSLEGNVSFTVGFDETAEIHWEGQMKASVLNTVTVPPPPPLGTQF